MGRPSILPRHLLVAALTAAFVSTSVSGCQESGSGQPKPERRALKSRTEQPRIELVEVSRSDPDADLSYVTSMDVDSRGRIYVGDWTNEQVTVFSPDGDILRRIGRRGEGPGEFRQVHIVQILPGDSLLVYDVALGRVSVFSPEADTVAYTVNLGAASRWSSPYWLRRARTQPLFVAAYTRSYSPTDDPSQEASRTDIVRLLTLNGSLHRDSVLLFPSKQHTVVRSEGSVFVLQNPFGRQGVLALSQGAKLLYGWTDSLVIYTYSLDGQLLGTLSYPYRPAPVTQQEIEDAASRGAVFGNEQAYRVALRRQAPDRWPAFRDFAVDDQGRIWVSVLGPGGQSSEALIFSGVGQYLTSVTLPQANDLKIVTGEFAYAVAKDELDVPSIVVYRVTESGSPPPR